MIGLADDIMFQAAGNVAFGLSFGGAACDVGFGGFVKAHAYDDCSIDGGLELSVAAVVDAVASGRGTQMVRGSD